MAVGRLLAYFLSLSLLLTNFSVQAAVPGPGVTDLTAWKGQGLQNLAGPWELHWQKLLEPDDEPGDPDFYLESGAYWNDLKGRDGNALGSFGFGTYRLMIKGMRANPQGYSILIPSASSAMRVFLVDSTTHKVLATDDSGRLGYTAAEEQPSRRVAKLHIGPEFSGDLTVLVQVSNFHLGRGGMRSTPWLGVGNAPRQKLEYLTYQDFAMMGITSAIGIYLFMMWFRNRKELASLCLTLVCLGAIVRSLVSNVLLLNDFFSEYFFLTTRVDYFTLVFGGGFGVQFIGRSFTLGRFARYFRDGYLLLALLASVFPFLASPYTFSANLGILQLLALSAYFFYYPVLIKASLRREEGALLCFFGVSLVFLSMVVDILVANNVIKSDLVFYPAGFAIFLILLAQIVAKKAATAHANVEKYAKDIAGLNGSLKLEIARGNELNAQLESKVAERTKEIRSLLQHIPQGILTIGAGGHIGSNFSAHLPEIVGQREIAHRSFKEMILHRSDLSADMQDRAWQTILNCIGESTLNFELNIENLPTQFGFHGSANIVLRCTWNFEADDVGNIRNILVTLLDITSEVESQKLLDEKNKEFEVIHQLIDVDADKTKQFFASGEDLLGENQRLINDEEIDLESIKILFINMHTLKGAARTLRWLAMADCFHHVESYYSDILKHGAAVDRERLRQELAVASTLFAKYESVNRNVLGRSVNYGEISIDRDFLEQNFHILKVLDNDSLVNTSLKQIIHDNCDKLVKIIFFSLPTVIDDVMKSASRMAKDLSKPDPVIDVNMQDILVNRKQDMALRHSLIHLLRNSLDHGIENPEIRLSKGKSSQGKISLWAEESGDRVLMHYEDDGSGLNIAKLKKKGLHENIISAGSSLQEIAELIFLPGVSTSASVNHISGRGMGMDAVRRFLSAIGAKISISLGEVLDSTQQCYRFKFVIEMPRADSSAIASGKMLEAI